MSKETLNIDVAIVGGGIVGLWSAYHILKKYPNLILAVFESEVFLGEHSTGRNSEVLHSGLYYAQNSLKHIHCLEGNLLWRDYIKEKSMSFLDCGKVIVAKKGQEESLEKLRQKCHENRIAKFRSLSTSEINSYKDMLNIENGILVGSAGVLNVSEALKSLKNDIEAMGGMILTKNKVNIVQCSEERFLLEVNGDLILSSILLNTAGLFSVEFRKSLQLSDYENFYVKGNYLTLKKSIKLDKLMYPIPPIDGLGLGVHLTLDTSGGVKFGPNTEIVDSVDYSINQSLLEQMSPSIHSIFKNIRDEDLQLGYAGVRPKVKRNGLLVTDFVFNTEKEHGIKGYYEFLGIESPGLTASPSLGKMFSMAL